MNVNNRHVKHKDINASDLPNIYLLAIRNNEYFGVARAAFNKSTVDTDRFGHEAAAEFMCVSHLVALNQH